MPTSSILGSLGLGSFSSTPPSLPQGGPSVTSQRPTSTSLSSLLTGVLQPVTSLAGVLQPVTSVAGATGGLQPVPSLASSSKAMDTMVVAPGVPALKRSLVDLILAGKYTDLGELPPAKGFGKAPAALSSDVEGKFVLLQAADYVHSKKHIPDLATWVQCFAIYSSVLLTKYPERAQSLLMYSATIARLSKKFRWPSWIIYDQYFRQEAADTGKTDWAKIDSSIHTQCFTGMSLSAEGWCSICTSMDHTKQTCPYRPQEEFTGSKRPLTRTGTPAKKARVHFRSEEACRKWNKYHYMSCPHGESCAYVHECSVCRATDHGALRCPQVKPTTKPKS